MRLLPTSLLCSLSLSLGLLLSLSLSLPAAAQEAQFWNLLKQGGQIVLMRHAQTVPGIGDPAGFSHADCATQRNLSAQGRAHAERIGAQFRQRAIPVQEVWSSRWCRCTDTARLAFGRVTPQRMLDSMFAHQESTDQEKLDALYPALAAYAGKGNLVLVTHEVNIRALAGVSPASGEMLIVERDGPRQLRVLARLP